MVADAVVAHSILGHLVDEAVGCSASNHSWLQGSNLSKEILHIVPDFDTGGPKSGWVVHVMEGNATEPSHEAFRGDAEVLCKFPVPGAFRGVVAEFQGVSRPAQKSSRGVVHEKIEYERLEVDDAALLGQWKTSQKVFNVLG